VNGRQPLVVALAVAWLAVDVVLLRIASGGNLLDWEYVAHTQPLVFVTTIMVAVGNVVAVGLVLRHPLRPVLLALAAWGGLVAVFGVALRVAHHDSGTLVVVGSLACAWLALRAAAGAPRPGRHT
jgi:hypothetical protein